MTTNADILNGGMSWAPTFAKLAAWRSPVLFLAAMSAMLFVARVVGLTGCKNLMMSG